MRRPPRSRAPRSRSSSTRTARTSRSSPALADELHGLPAHALEQHTRRTVARDLEVRAEQRDQRLEREPALEQPRMRELELRRADHALAPDEDIEIDHPRTEAWGGGP